MNYDLPTSVTLDDMEYQILYDYRAILDIFEALNTEDAPEEDRVDAALQIFFPEYDLIPRHLRQQAAEEMFFFINGGEKNDDFDTAEKLMDWEYDFKHIIAPVNRILGFEARSVPYDRKNNTGGVHWWTFLSAYMEIGDCFFAQVVGIRSKRNRNKKLEKHEQEFYRKNRKIIDLPTRYTQAEIDLLKQWT